MTSAASHSARRATLLCKVSLLAPVPRPLWQICRRCQPTMSRHFLGGTPCRSRVARRAPVTAALVISALVLRRSSRRPSAPRTDSRSRLRSGRRRRAGQQGQFRPHRLVDARRRRRAVIERHAERLDRKPHRRRQRRRRRRRGAGQAGYRPTRRHRPGGCDEQLVDHPRHRAWWWRRGRVADLDPRQRRGRRQHHAHDQYAGADRGVGQGVQVRPDAEERHGPGRDRLGERDRPVASWDITDDAHGVPPMRLPRSSRPARPTSISVSAKPPRERAGAAIPDHRSTATAGDPRRSMPICRSRSRARTA